MYVRLSPKTTAAETKVKNWSQLYRGIRAAVGKYLVISGKPARGFPAFQEDFVEQLSNSDEFWVSEDGLDRALEAYLSDPEGDYKSGRISNSENFLDRLYSYLQGMEDRVTEFYKNKANHPNGYAPPTTFKWAVNGVSCTIEYVTDRIASDLVGIPTQEEKEDAPTTLPNEVRTLAKQVLPVYKKLKTQFGFSDTQTRESKRTLEAVLQALSSNKPLAFSQAQILFDDLEDLLGSLIWMKRSGSGKLLSGQVWSRVVAEYKAAGGTSARLSGAVSANKHRKGAEVLAWAALRKEFVAGCPKSKLLPVIDLMSQLAQLDGMSRMLY